LDVRVLDSADPHRLRDELLAQSAPTFSEEACRGRDQVVLVRAQAES
jgi:hypothetical protein